MPDNLPVPTDPDGQAILFSVDDWDEAIIVESEHARGVHTFARMLAREPDRAEAILSLVVEPGASQRHIAKICRCSRNSVAAGLRYALSQPDIVEPLKKRSAALWGAIKQLSAERALELLSDDDYKPSLRDLAIMAGTAEDKEQLLRGEATQRIEVIDSASGADDFERQFAALQQADVQEMGFAGEISAAKGVADGGDDDDLAAGCVAGVSGSGPDQGPDPLAADALQEGCQ